MFRFYPFVDVKKVDSYGESPVHLIVSRKNDGRFWVSTGLRSHGKLLGMGFSPKTRNAKSRTMSLFRILSDTETLLLREDVEALPLGEVKSLLMEKVLGIKRKESVASLADYVASFSKTKKQATAVLYGITERKVREYAPYVTLSDIDSDWLECFRLWCLSNGMKTNGAGKELRNIRAVFNWCVRKGYTDNYPFTDYSIPEEETLPNNMSVEDLRRLRDYECEEWQQRYVDFFMLSFYLAGINPGDLLLMRKDAVRDGHLSFVRRKTDKQGAKKIRTIVLPVVDEARKIIGKYPSREGYLLGFMDGRSDYHSFVRECNKALKKVGTSEIVPDKTGKRRKVLYHPLFPDITLYTTRYSFGSIAANDLDISEQTIGQCLGHSWSKRVTARYIAHDQRKVDNAVRRVVEYVGQGLLSDHI